MRPMRGKEAHLNSKDMEQDLIRVLHVEDDPFDRGLVRESLKAGGGFFLAEAVRQADFLRLLDAEEWDCVLTDLQLSGYTGLDVLDRVRALKPGLPVVFLASAGSEELAVEAMKKGAADYLLKNPVHYVKLPLVLRNAVSARVAQAERARAEEALEQRERAYREMFEANPSPMWIYDPGSLKILEVNAAATRAYGWSREEFLHMNLTEVDEAPGAREYATKSAAGGTPREVRQHRRKDGTFLFAEVSSGDLAWGEKAARVALVHDITDRVRAEEDMKETLAELNTIQQAAPVGIVLASNRVIIRANDALSRISGYSREDLTWKPASMLCLSEDDAQKFWDVAEPQIARTGRYVCDRQIRCKDGSMRWVRMTGRAIDRTELWKGAIWVLEDYEEARSAQEALGRLAEDLAQAQRVGRLGSWSRNFDTGEVIYSAEQSRLFGLDPTEQPPKSVDQFLLLVREEDRAAMAAAYDRVMRTGEPEELDIRAARATEGERWLHVSMRGERDASGHVYRAFGINQDVSAAKNAAQVVERSRDFYKGLFEEFPTLVWRTDPARACTFVNAAWTQFTGLPVEQALGRGWDDVTHPDDIDRCHEVFGAHFETRTPVVTEYRLRKSDGGYHWVRDCGAPYFDADGRYAGFVGTCFDITDRVEAEQQLAAASADLADAQRVGNMGSWSLDAATGRLSWSDHQYRLYGFEPGGAAPATLEEFLGCVHEEDRDLVAQAMSRCLEQGESLAIEFRIRCPAGDPRWIRGSAEAQRDATGKVVRARGINQDITEQKKILETVERSRDFHLTLLDKFPTVVWRADLQGRCDYLNSRWEEFTGSPRKLAVEDGWTDCIHPEDRERVKDFALNAKREHEWFALEYRLRHVDGGYRWVRDVGGPYRDLDGKLAGFIGTLIDVNDRVTAEHNLRESEARLKTILENMPVMLDAFDTQGNIVAWNRECERVTGYGAAEIVGNPRAMELLYPDAGYRTEMLERWKARGNDYRGWEWSLTAKDGSRRVILWSNQSRDFPVQGWATWGTGVDITAWRRAEQQLEESEKRFRSVIDVAADGIFVADLDGNIVDFNTAACASLGYTCEELQRMNVRQLDPEAADLPQGELRRLHEQAMREPVLWEGTHLRRDGTTFPVQVRIAGVRLGDRDFVVGIARNVTEQKKAVEELAASELRFRTLIEKSTDILVVVDREGVFQYSGPSVWDLLGYVPGGLIGTSAFDLVHPDDVGRAGQLLAELLTRPGGTVRETLRIRDAEGGWRDVDFLARNLLDNPVVGGIVINARDISGRAPG